MTTKEPLYDDIFINNHEFFPTRISGISVPEIKYR